jgi:hypothetical protein
MINVTTIRWQDVPVIGRHRHRQWSAVGDLDQHRNRFNRICADGSPPAIAPALRHAPFGRHYAGASKLLAPVTEADADRLCLLPDRGFSPFQRFGDLHGRGPCFRVRLERADVIFRPGIASRDLRLGHEFGSSYL